MGKQRGTAMAAVVAVACAGLSGCTPAIVGATGITADSDGSITVLIATCDGRGDGVRLEAHSAPNGADPAASIEMRLRRDSAYEVPLSDLMAVDSLDPDDLYLVEANSRSSGKRFDGLSFAPSDLSRLQPGEVLIAPPPVKSDGAQPGQTDTIDPDRLTTVDDFWQERGCGATP